MRLRRVEAVRYGRLKGDSLGVLGDGLTVVHGPNEAGKSTFTALVRHVLYGYPTQREKEQGYFVDGEGRLARLVFEEGGGRWVVERAEGTHGGDVRVRTLEGHDRPGLLAEVTRGVSALAYRVVFGFGLDEMARIEELRGSDDDIIAKLYAASAGLRVSPQEVRAAVEREAADLFKPAGRKPELNALVSSVRATRGEIRDLRARADSFQADQQRRRELERRLAEARQARDAARSIAMERTMAFEKAEERAEVIRGQEEALLELRLRRKQLDDERAGISLDRAVLDRAPELEAMLDEAAGYAQGCEVLKNAEAALARAQARARDALARSHLSPEVASTLAADHTLSTAVDEARDDLQRLQLQCESREEEAERVASLATQADAAVARALEPLGLSAENAEEAIAERLAALDALESLRGGAHVAARRGADVPAIIMLVSGIAAIATGIFLREWVSLGIGVVLSVAGVWFLLRARAGAPALPVADERPYLSALGLDSDAGTLELSRTRRALDAARQAAVAGRDAHTRAAEAARDAGLARDALATRRELWRSWLDDRGLPADLTPAAAAQVLVAVREAQTAAGAEDDARAETERIALGLDGLATRLAHGARGLVEVPDPASRDDVPVLAIRIRERLSAVRTASARIEELGREIASLDSRIDAEAERASKAAIELHEILARHGLADGGTREDLAVLRAQAELDAREAEQAFDEIAEEKNQLEGRLEGEAHERRGSELRLEEAGIVERLGDALDRYLVLATAAQLLADAQARYERERQPEVVRRAAQLFERITGDAYVGLSVPLGDGRMEVFDARAGARTSDVLSRGTAEQLYLALRLGLIAQLGEVGEGLPVLMDDVFVNFDPERKRGAAQAVTELASERQVVFFTCHPETVDLFDEIAPGHTRLEIPRCDR